VPLPELHPSLNNKSKIKHMIATKRHAEHPYGQDIMNMSFKRIHGPINKWEVSLVFACAFTILQTADTYKKLFEELFNCVEQDCEHPVEFQHVHGRGIGCILADKHYGQALGQYLAEKFPIFNATEHLEQIYKLCTIHFKR
ncbi:6926_t:CDS:2, partial [Scutellospora calospora]